jgi:hypothetical protein
MNKSNGSNNSNRSNGNNRSNGSNNKSNNNNRSSGNRSNNSRFNFVNEEIQANKAKDIKEKTSDKPKETNQKPIDKPKDVNQKPKENMFTNSRFSMSRLMEDYPTLPKKPESESIIRPILTPPRPVPLVNVKIPVKDDFPTLSTAKIQIKDDFPTLASSNVMKSEPAKINFKKAINTVDNVVIEEKQFVPKPGWVYFIKNKAGKTELVYGPKSIEQKRNEYQNKSWNYQMYLAISKMESRWASEKQLYNIIRGENAYQSRYDNTTSYNSDNDSDMDETDVNTTDDDSDYETE